ncbi:MAG TPA: ABC transporter ATP-binding protein [Polyangiales bacterium]|nr:ABC transporter ATP-binding protein [Polyangiales bacterium]
MEPVLKIHDLTVGYDGHAAVHHLCGAFMEGSLTALVGPNGAGKSTLLNALTGQMRPLSGRVERAANVARIAYLPQQSEIDRAFPLSVVELVSLGAWHRIGSTGAVSSAVRRDALEALHAVGLEGFHDRALGSLSVGQLQRALFARVLLIDAPLILLDEPFNAIDARTTRDLVDVVRRWHRERRTVIAVLHDLEQVRRNFPECLLLAREAVAWGATADVLVPENLARVQRLVERWDETAPWCARSAAS